MFSFLSCLKIEMDITENNSKNRPKEHATGEQA